jgi:hypothetical protein
MGLATIIFIIGALLIMLVILPSLPSNLAKAYGQAAVSKDSAKYDLQQKEATDQQFNKQGLFGYVGSYLFGNSGSTNENSPNKSTPTDRRGKSQQTSILDTGEKGSSLYKIGNRTQEVYLRPDEVAYYQKSGVKVTPVQTNVLQDFSHGFTEVFN